MHSHGTAGNSHSHWTGFLFPPIPIPISVLFPFPWDSHGIPNPWDSHSHWESHSHAHLYLGVMSRDATFVINTCTKFELDTTYRSRVRTTAIFHWPQLSPNFYVSGGLRGPISNFIFLTPKGTTLARATYNDVLRMGMRPVAVAKRQK